MKLLLDIVARSIVLSLFLAFLFISVWPVLSENPAMFFAAVGFICICIWAIHRTVKP